MATATITSKGQVTIPKEIREALGLAVGHQIVFHLREGGIAEMIPVTVAVLSLRGILKPRKRGPGSSGKLDGEKTAHAVKFFKRGGDVAGSLRLPDCRGRNVGRLRRIGHNLAEAAAGARVLGALSAG